MAEDLMSRVAADLDGSFELLVRAYQHTVFTAALRWSGNRQDAEDLAQETFLSAYRALTDYPHERVAAIRPRPWLLTIALNGFRNRTRSAGRRLRTAPLEVDVADGRAGPDEVAERHRDGERAGELVDRLPERYRVPVVLRHVVGLGYAEIAAVLDCPVGTAKAQVSRGLVLLRQAANGSQPPDPRPPAALTEVLS